MKQNSSYHNPNSNHHTIDLLIPHIAFIKTYIIIHEEHSPVKFKGNLLKKMEFKLALKEVNTSEINQVMEILITNDNKLNLYSFSLSLAHFSNDALINLNLDSIQIIYV